MSLSFSLPDTWGLQGIRLPHARDPTKPITHAGFWNILVVCPRCHPGIRPESYVLLVRTPGNLDPTQFENNHIILTWQGKAPVYEGDLDVFLHEHYKQLLESRCAVISLFPGADEKVITLLI